MARDTRPRVTRQVYDRQRKDLLAQRRRDLEAIELLALVLVADADDEQEVLVASAISLLAREEARQLKKNMRSGKWGRRGAYDQRRSEDFFRILLEDSSDRWFRDWFRMDRDSFWDLHRLISGDTVFVSATQPQRPVKYQLATFLCRAGAESTVKTAAMMAISEGTVFDYCKRVTRALRRLQDTFLRWPTLSERDELSIAMTKWFFPGCLGSADGSLFRLADRPLKNPWQYFCRKKYHALVRQATVHHRARHTSYELGWPGSVQDSRIFQESTLWKERNRFFRQHEYIIVDKGYPLTIFSIRPFNDNDLTNDPVEASRRKKWNKQLSSLRIFAEHTFGRLKGHFPILQCIPSRHPHDTYRMIEAILVLHNILESRQDDPRCIPRYNGEAAQDDRVEIEESEGEESRDILYAEGLERRKRLMMYFEANV